MQKPLFELPEEQPQGKQPDQGGVRLKRANRRQVEMQSRALDELIPADHPARAIWDLVEGLDLSPLCSNSGAGEADSGQNAVDPAILMALWLYAACDGVGSARELARLCEEHLVYQWLRAGVQLGDQALSGFRLAHAAWLDGWLTRNVAALLFDGRLSLQKGVKDGVRLRFRSGNSWSQPQLSLKKCLKVADKQVAVLKAELEDSPDATYARRWADQERAEAEIKRRAKAILKHVQAQQTIALKKDNDKAGKR